MAEKSVGNVKKRGGRTATLTGSKRKRRKKERVIRSYQKRIYKIDTVERWRALKHKTNAKTHEEIADMLIER